MIVLGVLIFLAILTGSALVFWGLIQLIETLERQENAGNTDELRKRIQDLEYTADLLPQKWEEMVKEARRAEGRAHAAVRRARQELQTRGFADANLDEHADELRELDDLRSGNGSVSPVRAEVASNAPPQTADDWEALTRRKKYGF